MILYLWVETTLCTLFASPKHRARSHHIGNREPHCPSCNRASPSWSCCSQEDNAALYRKTVDLPPSVHQTNILSWAWRFVSKHMNNTWTTAPIKMQSTRRTYQTKFPLFGEVDPLAVDRDHGEGHDLLNGLDTSLRWGDKWYRVGIKHPSMCILYKGISVSNHASIETNNVIGELSDNWMNWSARV